MKELERLAAVTGRTVDEQADYILRVGLGLRAADPDDKAGRELAWIVNRSLGGRPLTG